MNRLASRWSSRISVPKLQNHAEAAIILDKPALKATAKHFRKSSEARRALAGASLPEGITPFKETRELMEQRSVLFVENGCAALTQINQIDKRLGALRNESGDNFPLGAAGTRALLKRIAERVQRIHDIAELAVEQLRASMSG